MMMTATVRFPRQPETNLFHVRIAVGVLRLRTHINCQIIAVDPTLIAARHHRGSVDEHRMLELQETKRHGIDRVLSTVHVRFFSTGLRDVRISVRPMRRRSLGPSTG